MDEIALLWSGGIDSTVMAAYLASKGYKVKPFYISRGCGHTPREIDAISKLYPILKKKFPSIEKPTYLKKRIGKCENRNERMVNLLKIYGVKKIALGSYRECRYPEDNDNEILSSRNGIEVLTWDTFGVHSKREVIEIAKEMGIYEILKYTWSCQLWFKKQCGICFSCKRRREYLGDLNEDFIYKTKEESIRYVEELHSITQKTLVGIDPKEVKKMAEKIEANPLRIFPKSFKHCEGGLHSEDIALYKLICEMLKIPRYEYTYSLDIDGYHYLFFSSPRSIEKWRLFDKLIDEYRDIEMIYFRVLFRLNNYFSRRTYIRERKLKKIIEEEKERSERNFREFLMKI